MQFRKPAYLSLSLILAGGLLASTADAQALKADRIITGVSSPIWIGSPPGDDRIFVMEQTTDLIKVYQNPIGAPTTFLNLATAGGASGSGERGSLSMAFAPDFAVSGHFYVYYTYGGNGSRIERYTVTPPTANVANPASGLTILEQTQPFGNHNGGNIDFSPIDGYLYFAFGDGGSANDPGCRAQKGDTWLGKMLRIDPTVDAFPADPNRHYSVPLDNPFVGDAGVLDEIYHLGLRNPWRWGFDPATGDMYIGDVGQDSREEIDFAAAGDGGLNYGWKQQEGATVCKSLSACPTGLDAPPPCMSPLLTDPIFDYSHVSIGGFCHTVVGGLVYRGDAIPDLQGTYFFAEHCGGSEPIWTGTYNPISGLLENVQDRNPELDPAGGFNIDGVRSFGYDGNGELLISDANEVYRILPAASLEADTVSFSVSAGGTHTLALDAPTSVGGDFYFLGGSLTGTSGITVAGVTIPLTLDAYTTYTLTNPNQVPLLNNFAQLNGEGNATATFTAGPGVLPVSAVGTTGYHAYAVLDAFFLPDQASNYTEVDFLP